MENVDVARMKNDYSFPFPPYDIQKQFMDDLYSTIEEEKIGIFESPTGTGKSLSLICGALTWLERNTSNGMIVEKLRTDLNKSVSSEAANTDEPAWLKEYSIQKKFDESRLKRERDEKYLIRINSRIEAIRSGVFQQGKRTRIKSTQPTSEHQMESSRKDFVLDSYESDENDKNNERSLSENDQSDEEDSAEVTKIFYCSRTHSQLSQFVEEIKKTVFGKRVRCITLGSRRSLCINPIVQRLKDDSLMSDKCMEYRRDGSSNRKGCPFYSRDKQFLYRDHALAHIKDIEELATLGKKIVSCAYYGNRKALPFAEVVALPYSMLLSRETREAVGISLKGNIVIIDEAHNIMDAVNQTHSYTVHLREIEQSYDQLSEYFKNYQRKLKGRNCFYIRQILSVLQVLKAFLDTSIKARSEGRKIFSIQDFGFCTSIDNFNLFKLEAYLRKSGILQKLLGFREIKSKNDVENHVRTPFESQKEDKRSLSPLTNIQRFLYALTTADVNGRVLVQFRHHAAENTQPFLKFLLLNPADHFREIVDDARSIILAGGTMQPFSDLIAQLFPFVSPDRINSFSCGHIIPSNNLYVANVTHGPTQKLFDFTFESRKSHEMIDEVGRLVFNVAKVVPGGIVCFLPSYAYEELIIDRWKFTGVLGSIAKRKPVHRESRDSACLDKVLEEYRACCKEESGALLFSVVGGRLSEGINFSDDLARCVIMVGLPYPNARDLELLEKMKYFDNLCRVRSDANSGREYYENLCMKAVNQSIGRSIRHKNDYSSILLIDKRYSQDRIKARLPTWIGDSTVNPQTFGKLYVDLCLSMYN